jgi:zinc transport system substrate-binding protein
MRRPLAACLVALVAVATAEAAAAVSPAAAGRLGAVATITPLGFLLEELGGARVAVRVLVPPGATPHAFEPRPADVAAVAGAALFVQAGPAVDAWAARLALAEGPAPLVLGEALGRHAPEDPHFWLDPIAVRDGALRAR